MLFQTPFHKGCLLVVGGAKSGKSRFALEVCKASPGKRIFLATAQALDGEMEERISRHRAERGKAWRTVEEPLDIARSIAALDNEKTTILVDCITLWMNNLYMAFGNDRESISQTVEVFLKQLSGIRGRMVVVSNEIGMGIVPGDPVSRRYRDDVGLLNQRIAAIARKVVTVIAGIPLVLKDE
jgi:adenosylcobinamide kinase/adenosylcobinamide-phosphate guanylyltransferase